MKRMLLHTCCGPCLTVPEQSFRSGYSLTSYFYNPNIHPSLEYKRRLETLADFCETFNVPLIVADYDMPAYFRRVVGDEDNRCLHCYSLRLGQTARFAAEQGFDVFSTTLSVSPYQDHELLRSVGSRVAEEHGVPFVYEDFSPLYRRSVERSRELGMYRQAYCGCVYSEKERYETKLKKVKSG